MRLTFVIFVLVCVQVGILDGTQNTSAEVSLSYPTKHGPHRQQNDPCIVNSTKENGTCTLIEECKHISLEIKRGNFSSLCAFENGKQIICCPELRNNVMERSDPDSRISTKMCNEYHKILLMDLNVRYDHDNNIVCPIALSDYIMDGIAVPPKELPHSALIGFDDPFEGNIIWACGGTLISDQFGLTAAHCLELKRFGHAKYVRLGDLDYAIETEEAEPVQVNIIQRFQHPSFIMDGSKYDDIALLRLEKSVKFNDFVFPACLPVSESTSCNATASGWGRTNETATTTYLRKVELEMFTHQECNEEYKVFGTKALPKGITRSQLCYGQHIGHGDTCQGDSGGPLQIAHDAFPCMYTVFGVTSFGAPCGVRTPSVYTRVYSYLDWIEGIVWQ